MEAHGKSAAGARGTNPSLLHLDAAEAFPAKAQKNAAGKCLRRKKELLPFSPAY